MNKQNLISKISEVSGLTKKDTQLFLGAFVDVIQDALYEGEEVSISDFGKFVVAEREARVGRNPKTGEEIQIHASKGIKFKVAKKLKTIVNK